MRISERSVEEVRAAADIVEVASEFTALRRQGARFTGLCPYPDHQEKTPSFSVSPDRGFYYCFGCSRGGDAIKLVSELKSFSFVDAVTYLAERSGIELEFEGSAADAEAAKKRSLRRRQIHRALAAATVYYHKYLLKSGSDEAQRARSYLQGRGIEFSTIEEFRLGYAPPRGASGFTGAAGRLGLDRGILDEAGLLSARGGERFAGRITFPISDRRGRIVGFGARALGDEQPKYLNSPESGIFNKRDLLYGLPQVSEAISRERAALIVEGYTDVLMLYQAGIKNAVATLGTATTPGHLKLLGNYVDKVYALFDPDAAGERAMERVVWANELTVTAARLQLDLRLLRLSEDPADWLLKHSAEEFMDLLAGAMPILEYSIRRIAHEHRGSDAVSRSRAVPKAKELIDKIEDSVLRREAIRLASEALGVDPGTLQEKRRRVPVSAEESTLQAGSNDPHEHAGREVLALIFAVPDVAAGLLDDGVQVPSLPEPLALRAADFCNDTQANVFSLLLEHRDMGSLLADDRARPYMDPLAALNSRAEEIRQDDLYPSRASVREAWLRLGILSRQRDKRKTSDYDRKTLLQAEIQALKEALRAVSAEP